MRECKADCPSAEQPRHRPLRCCCKGDSCQDIEIELVGQGPADHKQRPSLYGQEKQRFHHAFLSQRRVQRRRPNSQDCKDGSSADPIERVDPNDAFAEEVGCSSRFPKTPARHRGHDEARNDEEQVDARKAEVSQASEHRDTCAIHTFRVDLMVDDYPSCS